MAGRTGPLPAEHLVELDAVVVTTPERAAADLARLLSRPDALAALDAMARSASVDLREVTALLVDFAGYRGIRQARELLTPADPRVESPPSSTALPSCWGAASDSAATIRRAAAGSAGTGEPDGR